MMRSALNVVWGMVIVAGLAVPASAADPSPLVRNILEETSFKGGLGVFIGFEDHAPLREAAAHGNFLVHGLHPNRDAVRSAREALNGDGTYGLVSVACHSLGRLPYADNLVNWLVVENPSVLKARSPGAGEVFRVLCPGGVLYVRDGKSVSSILKEAGMEPLGPVEGAPGLLKFRKPRLEEMDEWTHVDYDGSRSDVSNDRVLGPLGRLRWIAGPNWSLIGHQAGFNRILSGGGRTFYLTLHDVANALDPEKQYDWNLKSASKDWKLVARDAFNGLLLWSRPAVLPAWNHTVVDGDLLYLLMGEEFVALDAATGKKVKTLGPAGDFNRLLQSGRILIRSGPSGMQVIHADTAKPLWNRPAAGDVLVTGDRVIVLDMAAKKLMGLELGSGKDLWSTDMASVSFGRGNSHPLWFCTSKIILGRTAKTPKDRPGIACAFSVEDGKLLWQREHISLAFPVAGKIWVSDKSILKGRAFVALDPVTGEGDTMVKVRAGIKRYFSPCYGTRPVATSRFFIAARPTDMYGWEDGKKFHFPHLRGSCGANTTPANGLLYGQGNDCNCLPGFFRGYVAMAPAVPSGRDTKGEIPTDRLEKGPAFGKASMGSFSSDTDPDSEWAHFRRDPSRSSVTPTRIPDAPVLLWEKRISARGAIASKAVISDWPVNPTGGDPLSQCVVAGGLVLAAMSDAHQVAALDARTGNVRWTYQGTGRMDTPPTLYKNRCLIGSRDGYVTCLQVADGRVVWRVRAAPEERLIVAFGQLESAWPVVGGVMIVNDRAIVVAGRGNNLDGGIHVLALNPGDGTVVWQTRSKPEGSFMCALPGTANGMVRIAENGRRGRGESQWYVDLRNGTTVKPDIPPPAVPWDRSWRYLGRNASGTGILSYVGPGAQMMVHSNDTYYLYKRILRRMRRDKITNFPDMSGVFALKGIKDKTAVWKNTEFGQPAQVEALILAGQTLCVGGPVDRADDSKGGFVRGLSITDGAKKFDLKLKSPPVWEGLSAADGRLYVSTRDGTVICYGKP